MSDRQKPPQAVLPDELVWAQGGHASDVVFTALADGELEIVPVEVQRHVESCPTCIEHLGNAALLSVYTAAEMGALRDAEVPARLRLPVGAIGAALALAVLGLVPRLLDPQPEPSSLRTFVLHDVPLVAQGVATLARKVFEPGNPAGLFLTYAAALMIVAMALAVVRFLPQKEGSS